MRRFSAAYLTAVGSLLACLLALVSALPASATPTTNARPSGYLALGDSLAFGYNPLLVQPGVNPSSFVGFPELVSTPSTNFASNLTVANAACPGETSDSLISGTRPDMGCQDYRQYIGPLHVSYAGSQLQYAKSYIAANPQTKYVSLTIGGNDLYRLLNACATAADKDACFLAGLPKVLNTVRANVNTVYTGLRAAGFKGDFVATTYYATNYADPVFTGVYVSLNQVLSSVTRSYGGKVLDGYGEFAKAARPFAGDTCKTGLLIHLTATTCDVHPSPAGAALLASTFRKAEAPSLWR